MIKTNSFSNVNQCVIHPSLRQKKNVNRYHYLAASNRYKKGKKLTFQVGSIDDFKNISLFGSLPTKQK